MSKTKFHPIANRMMVIADAPEERSVGGLFIPDNAKEQMQSGVVAATGDEVKEVKKGDKILFGKYSGSDVVIDNVTYLILTEEEVLCVILE